MAPKENPRGAWLGLSLVLLIGLFSGVGGRLTGRASGDGPVGCGGELEPHETESSDDALRSQQRRGRSASNESATCQAGLEPVSFSSGSTQCLPTLRCDGIQDDTVALKARLRATPLGGTLQLPDTGDGFCRVTATLTVPHGMTILGASTSATKRLARTEIRRTDVVPLSATHVDGAIFLVETSDVHFRRLVLTGSEYGNVQVRNTHGIFAAGTAKGRLRNIAIEDCSLTGFRGRAISIGYFDDFYLARNIIARAGYAGVYLYSVRRGRVRDNDVEDINDPETCALPGSTDPKDCQYVNGYPIVVTGCGGTPCSSDVIIDGNTVRRNERWVGIMNHGAQRVLVMDNSVEDTNFLYANTISAGDPSQGSDHTWFVNNFGDITPPSASPGAYDLPTIHDHGEGLWLVSYVDRPTVGVHVIGNEFRNTGNAGSQSAIVVHSLTESVISHNTLRSPDALPPQHGIYFKDGPHEHRELYVARNRITARHHGLVVAGSPAIELAIKYNSLLNAANWGLWMKSPGTIHLEGNDFSAAVQGEVSIRSEYPYSDTVITELAPRAIASLTAAPTPRPGAIRLSWTLSHHAHLGHDSFYIEVRSSRARLWSKLAYRPGDRTMWRFAAPSNPRFEAFDPLTYEVTGLTPGLGYDFRIRSQSGSAISDWSQVAHAVAP